MRDIESATAETLERERKFYEIFQKEIFPRYFEHLEKPHIDPEVYFVGGQPGSGKSVRERVLFSELSDKHPNAVVEINGDDYRAFHPDYYQLLVQDDATAASKIDRDNKFFIESCIKASVKSGAHVILEGTFRQPEVVRSTAEFYRKNGYNTQGILLDVHPILSRINILRRYCEQKKISPFARYTERRSHDAALDGIYETTALLISDKSLDTFTIIKQNGELLFKAYLKNLSEDACMVLATDAKNILHEAHSFLSREEIDFANHELGIIGNAIGSLNIPEIIKSDYEQLRRDLIESS